MDDILTEAAQFEHGILHDGAYFRDFILEEDIMRHALEVSNDSGLDWKRLAGDEKKDIPGDETYFHAAILAKRLKVEGVEKVTPEQVLNLSRADGQKLMALSSKLEQRRELFRSEAAANAQGHPDPPETGVQRGGSNQNEPREGA